MFFFVFDRLAVAMIQPRGFLQVLGFCFGGTGLDFEEGMGEEQAKGFPGLERTDHLGV